MKKQFWILSILMLVLIGVTSCQKDESITQAPTCIATISNDTIQFNVPFTIEANLSIPNGPEPLNAMSVELRNAPKVYEEYFGNTTDKTLMGSFIVCDSAQHPNGVWKYREDGWYDIWVQVYTDGSSWSDLKEFNLYIKH